MTMETTIEQTDLEQAVPVSTSGKSEIFDMVYPSIELALDDCLSNIVGPSFSQSILGNSVLLHRIKTYACQTAFLSMFRNLDLVLGASGFGIVSNDNLAPASQQRVDALEKQLRTDAEYHRCIIISSLTGLSGWGDTQQAANMIPHLWWSILDYDTYLVHQRVDAAVWSSVQTNISLACDMVEKYIGGEMMNELVTCIRHNDLGKDYYKLMALINNHISQLVRTELNPKACRLSYDKLMLELESDSTKYKSYFDSEAYKLNHITAYENIKEAGTFFWG